MKTKISSLLARFGVSALIVLLVAGCDYVPRTVYEVETKDGKTLKLLCPTVDRDRSEWTYLIDGECVAIQ